MLNICRLCLQSEGAGALYNIVDAGLQDTFETVTRFILNTDGYPQKLCVICYTQLQKCKKLIKMSSQSEMLLSLIAKNQFPDNSINMKINNTICTLVTSEIKVISIVPNTISNHIKKEHDTWEDVSDVKDGILEGKEEDLVSNTGIDTDMGDCDEGSEQKYNADDYFELTKTEFEDKQRVNDVKQVDSDGITAVERNTMMDRNSKSTKIVIEVPKYSLQIQNFSLLEDKNVYFICDYCKRFFKKKYLLRHHIFKNHMIKSELANNNYTETDIGNDVVIDKVKDEEKIIDNLKKIDKKVIKCGKCSMEFNYISYLKRHMRIHSRKDTNLVTKNIKTGEKSEKTVNLKVKCSECTKEFSKKSHLVRHMGTHTRGNVKTKKRYLCDTCNREFGYSSHLKRHMRTHTGEKPYGCDMCGKRFSVSHVLKEHMKMHSEGKYVKNDNDKNLRRLNMKGTFKCDLCGKVFGYKSHLKRHMFIHSGVKPYRCNSCDKRFTEEHYLKAHMKKHEEKKPMNDENIKKLSEMFKSSQISVKQLCHICGKTISSYNNLRTHMKTHSGKKPYRCKVCDKGFAQPSGLTKHAVCHTEKKFKCTICFISYYYRSNLRDHMMSHTGEKPYKCEFCGKGFARGNHLRLHRRIHTGEKPHQCEVCSKGFSNPSNLKEHMRTHTGEKPYKCDECDRAFLRLSFLKKHQEIHKNKVFK